MIKLDKYNVWFITGRHNLYGSDTLDQVDMNSKHIVTAWNFSADMPIHVKFKPVLTTPEDIHFMPSSQCR